MSDYSFNGIQHAEAQDRQTDLRTGVPGLGSGAVLAYAPIQRSSSVHCANISEADVCVRLRHGAKTKTQTAEKLTGLNAGSGRFVGKLQFGKIVPGTLVFTEAGAAADIVDDEEGALYDTGFVGTAANLRGTVDYETGEFDLTFAGAAATEPASVTYNHNDYTDFESASQSTTKASGGVTPSSGTPFEVQLGYGRVVPGSVVMADGGALTWTDDGKGNIIETSGTDAKRGTINYHTGLISLTGGAALTGTVTVSAYKYNPFAAKLVKGGGQKILDIFGQIPELMGEVWADGRKGETKLALWGEGATTKHGALIVLWGHFGEEPFRVEEPYGSVKAGGFVNDPNVIQDQAHL